MCLWKAHSLLPTAPGQKQGTMCKGLIFLLLILIKPCRDLQLLYVY